MENSLLPKSSLPVHKKSPNAPPPFFNVHTLQCGWQIKMGTTLLGGGGGGVEGVWDAMT